MRKRHKRVLQRQREGLIRFLSACDRCRMSAAQLAQSLDKLSKIKFRWQDDGR